MVFLLAVAAFPSQGRAESQGIMVWRLEKGKGVDEEVITTLSSYLTGQVEQYSGLKVVSEADIRTILKGAETKERCGVRDNSCIAEVGNALGVPEAISGDLGRMGDYWILNIRRINVRNAEVIKRVSRSILGDTNTLIVAVPGAVAELFGKEAPAPPPVPAEAAPVEKPKHEPKPEPPKEPGADQPKRTYPMNPYKKYGYVTFFTGLGLAAFGGIATGMSADKADDYHKASNASAAKGARDASRSWMGAAYAGYGLGGALMITGVVLWAVSPGDEAWWKAHSVSAGPSADGQGVVLSLSGRW